ncbi:MAG: Electron transfer flavoprotein, alpha subunit [uncultured Thermomicrobiales bacterium]|uniref:Electron transfer flavoprotein, alpha subunit n=1 Tax=uncultured Thermomicrobiales bacterium TaxID=1645740 RepID=A0A6J4UFS0_9BACT|nr:MAG: Electron transfer flavoprotein, alpha subunit [uncultured Thermomicrobiales bacterium]
MAVVLVVGEVGPDGLRPESAEAVTAARGVADGMGMPLVGLLLGPMAGDAAYGFAATGIDRLLVADDPHLVPLTTESGTAVVETAVRDLDARVVLAAGTTAGKDIVPRLAARLEVPSVADGIAFAVEGGQVVVTRGVLGGRVQSDVRFLGEGPWLATVRSGSHEKPASTGAGPAAEAFAVELGTRDLRVTVRETVAKTSGPSSLGSAEVVVSGGRGLKEPANFSLVEDLAGVFGGAVGATRAVVDAGWRPHHEQIGQTGTTVSPRLYIAVGISGAVQHNVGMQGSDYVVAINRDPDAPIFKSASFGIVGDAFEVVPALIAALGGAKR